MSRFYREDDETEGHHAPWIALVRKGIGPGGAVLDLGCGCGVPVARALIAAGCVVTGVDISEDFVPEGDRGHALVVARKT